MHLRRYELRFICIFFCLFLCLSYFVVKLVLIQVFKSSHLAYLAQKQHNYYLELEPIRGTIFDRRSRPLAINVPVYSLFANPKLMSAKDKSLVIRELAPLLQLNPQTVTERLNKPKYFVWLKRKLPLDKVEMIKKMKIKGLGFVNESKRYYPNGVLASHLIGFAGIDNTGLEGLELNYDEKLRGEPGWAFILRDAKQREMLIERNLKMPTDGSNLVLTIDETIQYIAERALEKAFKKHNAKAASIIVMNPKTGEILAFANRPTYNLESPEKSPIEARTNRALSYIYEPGSVFKIVPLAAALEEGVFKESDKIFCENGEYKVANHILHDHQKHGLLTFKEVFEVSSNIGVAKISQKLTPKTIYKYAQRFRFGMPTNIGLKGEVRGLLKPTSQWSKTSIAAIPMGHEVTTTSIQLLSALSSIANDGVYMKPHVVKYIKNNQGEIIESFEPTVVDDHVISRETALRMKEILAGAVENGTGKKAIIPGIRVAGKTGTAQKIVDGLYSHNSYYATFMGFAPVEDPQVAAIVIFDDPHPSYFGGTVSAPVFKEVVENTLRYLQVVEIEDKNKQVDITKAKR